MYGTFRGRETPMPSRDLANPFHSDVATKYLTPDSFVCINANNNSPSHKNSILPSSNETHPLSYLTRKWFVSANDEVWIAATTND